MPIRIRAVRRLLKKYCNIFRYTIRHKYVTMSLAIFLGTATFYNSLPKKHSLRVYKQTELNTTTEDPQTEDFLINTPGCYIPNYAKTFMFKREVVPAVKMSCGVRAIFIDTLANNRVQFRINITLMNKHYTRNNVFKCCYKFVSESKVRGRESDQLAYTKCEFFRNGETIMLESEIITVSCYSFLEQIYKDAYIKLKKIGSDIPIRTHNYSNIPWNILMLGIDGMSRTRVFDTMPQTSYYLRKYKWADFKGYQKVDHEDFSYLITVLTGKKMSTILSNCTSGSSKCAKFFIWEQYKDAGYVTAYGEDYFQYPDAFSKYKGFKTKSTDHYMRPLYMTRENRLEKILCTHNKPSATHLLEYAHNFVNTYKTKPFFGMFWIKSYTNNILNDPSLIDVEIAKFFEELNASGMYKNTFVIFYSDHGTRFGKNRLPMESYYDERLPMLFLWIPIEFQRLFAYEFHNLLLNQASLITPYDLYVTLADILKLSIKSSEQTQSEACPQCTSLFENKSLNRSCADAGVSVDLCSCHIMYKSESNESKTALEIAIAYIHNIWTSIKTIPYTMCKPLKYPSIMRSHVYRNGNKKYHVIAFSMSPNRLLFETFVVHDGENFELLSFRSISPYNVRGNCVLNNDHRPYCVCVPIVELLGGWEADEPVKLKKKLEELEEKWISEFDMN